MRAAGATMLILKYFLTVGTALTVGLLALNAHLVPSAPVAGAVVRTATSASLPTIPPKAQPVEEKLAAEPAPPAPAKPAARRSTQSTRAHQRSH